MKGGDGLRLTGFASNPGSTNGWQLMCVVHAGTNFPNTVYVGLSTVAHNGDISKHCKHYCAS